VQYRSRNLPSRRRIVQQPVAAHRPVGERSFDELPYPLFEDLLLLVGPNIQ
jgi:hypothetical protein